MVEKPNNVELLRQKIPRKTPMERKWDQAGLTYTQIPNVLLENAQRMELSGEDLLALIYLIKFDWKISKTDRPFPATTKLANLLGKTVRTIQRTLKSLESNTAPTKNGWSDKPGYIRRLSRHSPSGRQQSNEFDFENLRLVLNAIYKELESQDEAYNKRRPTKFSPTKFISKNNGVTSNNDFDDDLPF